MTQGGFLVKFNGKKSIRCYKVAFDYDLGKYWVNNKKQKIPRVKKITIEIKRK